MAPADTDAAVATAVVDGDPFADERTAALREIAAKRAVPKVDVPRSWTTPCTKCGGSGEYVSKHGVPSGVCFACKGNGRTFTPEGKRNYGRAKEAARAEHADRVAATLDDDPELADALTHIFDRSDDPELAHFARDIANKWARFGDLSDKQRDALVRFHQRETAPEEPAEDLPPAPEGKTEFSGTILSVKTKDYGYGPQLKMLVQSDEGWKAWMTVPKAATDNNWEWGVSDQDLKGTQVSLKATLEPSDDDPSFAFGKRPSLVGESSGFDGVPLVAARRLAEQGWEPDHHDVLVDAFQAEGELNAHYAARKVMMGEHPGEQVDPETVQRAVDTVRRAGGPPVELSMPDDWDADRARQHMESRRRGQQDRAEKAKTSSHYANIVKDKQAKREAARERLAERGLV